MSTYTAGWITVPGKGKRWRTTEGKYLMQRPAGSAPGVLNAIRSGWSRADAALGGWLPGGGVASPVTAPVRAVAGRTAARAGWALKGVRDAVIAPLPLPERLAITAVTGGTQGGGPVNRLSLDQLSAIKGIVDERDQNRRRLAASSDPQQRQAAASLLSGNQVSAYGKGNRDLHLGLGSFGVAPDGSGGVIIRDRWKVDRAVNDSRENKADLTEGGPIFQRVFQGALDLGTYRPLDIEVRVPADEWKRVKARTPARGSSWAPPDYMQGPQYAAGKDGVFVGGRNIAPWGVNSRWSNKKSVPPGGEGFIPLMPTGSMPYAGELPAGKPVKLNASQEAALMKSIFDAKSMGSLGEY